MGKEKKKHRKEKKEKKKKRRHRSSSSSSSSGDDEWVEKRSEKEKETEKGNERQERDEWMNLVDMLSVGSKDERREKKKPDEKKVVLDQPGQSSRELNPYWKNGGTGLPPTLSESNAHEKKDDRDFTDRRHESHRSMERRREEHNYRKSLFLKPDETASSVSDRGSKRESHSSSRSGSSKSSWRKSEYKTEPETGSQKSVAKADDDDDDNEGEKPKPVPDDELEFEDEDVQEVHRNGIKTKNELNRLAAQLIRAELMGKTELAKSFQALLEKERDKRKTVILTVTDNRGFVRPARFGDSQGAGPSRKHKSKVETHQDGKRVRYFADDDKYSLSEIFEREKLGESTSYDEAFYKLSKKHIGGEGSARDMDDVFEETARMDEEEKDLRRERNRAISEHKKREKVYESCAWCLDSKASSLDHVVSIGNQIYLCVPPYQSLTEGHCLIIPNQHIPCSTQADEDVWKDIMDMRKALVRYYESQEEDVIFFENAAYLNRHPHMVIHSVPVPKETGEMAPLYFKKAILECEMEWASNKKLVELAGKGVRRAIPKGLSYFSVDFGLQDGFAHVIEDRKLFPNNFAQEIIGGMLDLDHSLWRKQRREHSELQREKATQFKALFEPYNPIKSTVQS